MLTTRILTSGPHPSRLGLAARATAVLAIAGSMAITSSSTAVAVPAVPSGMPRAVDALPDYVGATTCSPTVKPGTKALMSLLLRSYPDSRSLGIVRACGSGGKSEHKEGRALDWGNRAWVPSEAANVTSFTRWALKRDNNGNPYAMARRLGIMYMIWSDHIWEASNPGAGWQPYLHRNCSRVSTCPTSLRHRDHLHISLSWDAAMGRTSFWSGRVSSGGSMRASRRAHASLSTARVARVTASIRQVSRFTLRQGSRGDAVVVLQKSLRMPMVTGYFGARTNTTVRRYQRSRGLHPDGVVGRSTWVRLKREIYTDSRRIAHTRRTVVKLGARGRHVKVLESALNRPVDGRYTYADRRAVVYFQRVHGIRPTGVVARLTWHSLRAA